MSEPRTYLVVLWDGGGVVPPLIGLARRLRQRGNRVVVLGDPTIRDEAAAVGAEFHPWVQAPHRTSRSRDADLIRDYAYSSQRTFFKEEFRGYFIDAGPRWTADVLDAIDRFGADAVVCDFMLPWAGVAAEARGLPCTVAVTFPYPVPTRGFPPQGSALMPVPRPLRGLRDGVLRWGTEWFYDKWLTTLNDVRSRAGMLPVAHALDQVRAADALLVLTARTFDHPHATAPSNVAWGGPVLDDPLWVEPWESPWRPDDPRPLVTVGLSSTYQAQVPVLQATVDALAGLPVRGLVSRGPTVAADEVRPQGDVAVVASVPHAEVLPNTAVFVTHCGHGSTMKALAAGVPMVCLPMGRDQTDNAARVAAMGLGVKLSPKADAQRIRRAVQRVLSEPSFGHAARAVQAQMRAGDGQRDPVEVIESTLAGVRVG